MTMKTLCLIVLAMFHLACSRRTPVSTGECATECPQGTLCQDGQCSLPRVESPPDAAPPRCDPLGDHDGDGISNGEEACEVDRDSDGDGIADWNDLDSDDDGISDSIERGPGIAPADDDGDNVANYLDLDSDDDGLLDRDEDRNGDGLLGCCLSRCGEMDPLWQKTRCPIESNGCGLGQQCESGSCSPTIDFLCSKGETLTTLADTFVDGRVDPQRGTWICREPTPDDPRGVMQLAPHQNVEGGFKLALPIDAAVSELALEQPLSGESAAAFQIAEVAGFVTTRPGAEPTARLAADRILQYLVGIGLGIGTEVLRSGTASADDGSETISQIAVRIYTLQPTSVQEIHHHLVANLLDRKTSTVGTAPSTTPVLGTEFMLNFAVIRRFDPEAQDQKSRWKELTIGGLSSWESWSDATNGAQFILTDLADASALSTLEATLAASCDVARMPPTQKVDFIWIVDESNSMKADKERLQGQANQFFEAAVDSGLDFRIGVTSIVAMDNPGKVPGRFCSEVSQDKEASGGEDRFLLPDEKAVFLGCIDNPPFYDSGNEMGLEVVKQTVVEHLPRAVEDSHKIRTDAKLVILLVSDEYPHALVEFPHSNWNNCSLTGVWQQYLKQQTLPLADLLNGQFDPEAMASFYVIGGLCPTSCGADVAHGYRELAQATGGQAADICLDDLSTFFSEMIASSAPPLDSPIVLQERPISHSISVALDGQVLTRSREKGFDYLPASKMLPFYGLKSGPGAEVVVSYRYWQLPTN